MSQSVTTTAGGYAVLSRRASDAAFAEIGRILVGASNTPPTAQDIGDLERHVEGMLRKHETVGVVVCVGERSTPGEDARQRLIALYRGVLQRVPAVAFVLGGQGIVAAVQEGVATTIIRAVGKSDSLRVFRELDDAVNWIADETHQGSEAGDLRRAARAFCDAHGANAR